ncbi:MAG: aspartate aminotransferase family protein [Candidatus Marinimicrobia bacterium]|nr:aspartate aminotransferase family protein [Candidatus Neomarinimicrobiota bacterium]
MKASDSKIAAIDLYRHHVSSGKVDFFKRYGMDFVMGRREGPYIYDIDGEKRLFNLHCNGGVFNLGHRHPELVEVLKSALDNFDIGNHHLMSRERALLAEMLADLMPGDLNYTIFGVGGGEAVDLAIKVARGYTGRSNIISARGGYHGHTGLAMATGDAKYRAAFGPQPAGFSQVPFNDLSALQTALDSNAAAVILETVPATLGMVIPNEGYLATVSDLCRKNGTLLIIDEVQTGLGRTGKLWGFEHFDIIPDIVVLGKGLSGGLYPLSATVLQEPLEQVFHADPFIHISTFGGSEIGCQIGRRVLEISSAPDFLNQVNKSATQFSYNLDVLQSNHTKFFKGVRQLGLMVGLELVDENSGPILTKAAFDHDILLVYAGNNPSVSQFLPPLNLNSSQIDVVCDQLGGALNSAWRLRKLFRSKQKIQNLWGRVSAPRNREEN